MGRIHLPVQHLKEESDIHADLLYYYAGKALALSGDFPAALEALQEAAKRNPQDPAVQIAIGSLYQEWLNNLHAPEALQALRNAQAAATKLRLSSQSLDADFAATVRYEEGLALELQGLNQDARTAYQDGIDRLARDSSAAYLLLLARARVEAKLGAEDEAIATLQGAANLVPAAPWAFIELAKLSHSDEERAQAYLQQASETHYGDFYVQLAKAEQCMTVPDHACVEEAYANALELRPNSGWLHSQVGQYYQPTANPQPHQGWQKAGEHFRLAAELRPNDPWAHERLAYVLMNQEQYDEAITEYRAAIRLMYAERLAVGAYCNLGIAQQRSRLLNEAQISYQRCLALAATPSGREHALSLLADLRKSMRLPKKN